MFLQNENVLDVSKVADVLCSTSLLQKELLSYCQENLNKQDKNGLTLLMWAIKVNNPDAVDRLLENNADINIQDNRQDTALHWATYLGRKELVLKLLAAKANPNFFNQEGKTPLHYAAERIEQLDLMSVLLENNAHYKGKKKESRQDSVLKQVIRQNSPAQLALIITACLKNGDFRSYLKLTAVSFPRLSAEIKKALAPITFHLSAEESTSIDSLAKQFYPLSQEIIEAYYLLPYPPNLFEKNPKKISKTNLKDGLIERQLHGGMHVCRAHFYATIFHNKIKVWFPLYTQNTLRQLSIFGLTEERFITLVRYALLFHDSARRNEGSDHWDQDSSKNFQDFLVNRGLSKKISQIFSNAAAYKDKKAAYKNFLQNQLLDQPLISALQYLRILIRLSDCLDIIRCVSSYKLTTLIEDFSDLEGYDPSKYEVDLVELITHTYHIIRKQKDLFFPVQVILTDNSVLNLSTTDSHYNLADKVTYEHADNVCSAIGHSLRENSYFAEHLKNEIFLPQQVTPTVAGFNPYVHATNSSVLATLFRCDFSLCSLLDLIEKYHVAPMSGELNRNGARLCINARSNTAFSRLRTSDAMNDFYSLDHLIRKYAYHPKESAQIVYDEAKNYIKHRIINNHSEINIMLIYILRSQQLGKNFNSKIQDLAVEKVTAIIHFYYLFKLIGAHIHPKVGLFKEYKKIKCEIEAGFEFHFTLEKLISYIVTSKINLKEIYHNPTAENLQKVLELLKLPINFISNYLKKEISLPETQFFSTISSGSEYSKQNDDYWCDSGNYIYWLDHVGDEYSPDSISSTLYGMFLFKHRFNNVFWQEVQKPVDRMIDFFENRLLLLKKFLSLKTETVKFTSNQLFFIDNQFPLIFIAEAEEKIEIYRFSHQEYRAKGSLKLKRDNIKMLATDTIKNQLILMKYLDEHRITNIDVVLFKDLRQAKETGRTPHSHYTHKDGFPLLSWLTAKKLPVNTALAKDQLNTLEESKIRKLNELLTDAANYNSVSYKLTS